MHRCSALPLLFAMNVSFGEGALVYKQEEQEEARLAFDAVSAFLGGCVSENNLKMCFRKNNNYIVAFEYSNTSQHT